MRVVLQRPFRAALAAKAVLVFVLMAFLHEEPLTMLVGFAPLALIAAEAAWHLAD